MSQILRDSSDFNNDVNLQPSNSGINLPALQVEISSEN